MIHIYVYQCTFITRIQIVLPTIISVYTIYYMRRVCCSSTALVYLHTSLMLYYYLQRSKPSVSVRLDGRDNVRYMYLHARHTAVSRTLLCTFVVRHRRSGRADHPGADEEWPVHVTGQSVSMWVTTDTKCGLQQSEHDPSSAQTPLPAGGTVRLCQ